MSNELLDILDKMKERIEIIEYESWLNHYNKRTSSCGYIKATKPVDIEFKPRDRNSMSLNGTHRRKTALWLTTEVWQ